MTICRRHLATLTERTEGANHARTSSPFAHAARIAYRIKSLQTACWPPEQQQYRDHFYARFELSLNFAFDNHYLTGEHIDQLREAMLNYTRSIGVSDNVQASLNLKLTLIEVQSP